MMKFLNLIVSKRLHTDEVEYTLQKLLYKNKDQKPKRYANRVAVIQKQIKPVKHVGHFIESIYCLVKHATDKGATYVVFPEYIFFDLFGILPFFHQINKHLNKRSFTKKAEVENSVHQSKDNWLLYHLFDLFAIPTEKVILHTMKHFAKYFSIYIYTGSFIHKENKQLYNVGSIIDPNGSIICTQRKVHLTDFEDNIGLARGNQFDVLEAPIGKIAAPVCMDATYFETFHLVRKKGANIVIIPIANNEPYNQWKALRGIWPRVQETYVYGLKSALTGSIGGMHFTGKAGIFAPMEMTTNHDGVIAMTEDSVGDEIVIADLDIKRLIIEREKAQYKNDVNPIFEQNYYSKTYGKFKKVNKSSNVINNES